MKTPRLLWVVLILLPLCLRLLPADHGLPRSYVPDTHMVKNALGMARDKTPFPEVGRYSTYPYLVPYILLPVYGAQYALGRATGEWNSTQEFGVRAMLEPQRVQYPARLLVAVLGALTGWIIYRAGRAAGLGVGAVAGGWLTATSLLHIQFSVQERPWVPMLFFASLSLWGVVCFARGGKQRALCASAVCAALAFSCHQAGAFWLLLCGFAWLVGPEWWAQTNDSEQSADSFFKRRLGAVKYGVLAVGVFFVAALLAGHSYYLVHGGTNAEAIAGGEQAQDLAIEVGGQALRTGFSIDSWNHLSTSLLGYEPALLLLFLIGVVPALRHRRLRALTCFGLVYAAFFMTNPNDHVRYLLPLSVAWALPAGLGFRLLWESKMAQLATRSLAVSLLALPLAQAARFVWLLKQPDTRADAEQLLAAMQQDTPGFRVAIDHYGPVVDLDQNSLEQLFTMREPRMREGKRYEFLANDWLPEDQAGLSAVYIDEFFEEDFETKEYGLRKGFRQEGQSPVAFLRSQGVTHLLIVDRRPNDGHAPHLQALVETAEPLWMVDPSSPEQDQLTKEALLPTDMDFPLTGLWTVSRPGPHMTLYRL